MVVVDEFGDYSKTTKRNVDGRYSPKKSFGFGISVVKDESRFRDVSKTFKNEKNIHTELKGRKNSVSEKKQLSKQIRRSGTKTYGYYVDKTKDVPEYWNSKDRSGAALSILKFSLKDIFKRIRSKDVEVVIDRHEIYRDKSKKEKNFDLAENVVKEVGKESNKNVSVEIPSSRKKGRYGEILQTHDIVSNGIYEFVENKDRSLVSILRTRIRRLTGKV